MKIYLLYFFVFLSSFLQAQEQYRFNNFNVSNGLSQNSVHCIFQDSDGVVWLGTQDGLNSFDGVSFKKYRNNLNDSNTISDQFILSIEEDNKGYLWIGTRNGLNRLNRRTGKVNRYYFSKNEADIIYSPLWELKKNSKGEIFVNRNGNKAVIDQDGVVKKLDTIFNQLYYPAFDDQGKIWGYYIREKKLCLGQYYLDHATRTNFSTEKIPLPNASFSKFKSVMDANKILWCYTDDTNSKLAFFDSRLRKWCHGVLSFTSKINHIAILKNGKALVGTSDGLYQVENYTTSKKIENTETNGLPSGEVLFTYEDKQGNIWVGSSNGGVSYYHPSFDNYHFFKLNEGTDAVSGILNTGNNIWLASSNGLFRLTKKPGNINSYEKNNVFFSGKKINAITNDKQNKLWVAVDRIGICRLSSEGKLEKIYMQSDSLLQTQNVLSMFCDSRGRLFVSTEKGFYVFTEDRKWQSFFQSNFSGNKTGWYVLSVFEDSHHRIWVSKHFGVDVYDENLKRLFSLPSANTKDPIKRTIITGCAEDLDGNVWIATLSGGVYKYQNNKRSKHYTVNEGLSGNVCYGINADSKGRIWVSSTTSLSVYKQSTDQFYTITTNDGISPLNFILGGMSKSSEGQLQLGTSSGFLIINADKIILDNKKAEAQISDVKINGESVPDLNLPLILEPDNKTVGFEFSLKEIFQPQKILYQYRMLGIDSGWNNLQSGQKGITYTNLYGGYLKMQVRAAYQSNELSTAPIEEIEIRIKPYFWKTNWFWVVVAIFINVVTSFIIIAFNKRKRKKQARLLEMQQQIQNERERISRDLHDNIGAYTSALIAGINQLKEGQNQADHIAELSEYATNIMDYLRETIWVLNHASISFTGFSDRFKSYVQKISRHYPGINIQFKTSITNDRELQPVMSLHLFRMLQEAMQNAFKHAGASDIKVSFISEGSMIFYIEDNGIGFDIPHAIHGNGLDNMEQRAKLIGFSCTVISSPGKGTTVTVKEK